ncbi:Growth hormone-regulated TBC protein 1-A-like, partial [Homarus americanus]
IWTACKIIVVVKECESVRGRMAASSESSNSRISDVDEYGFERPPDFNYQTYEEFMSRYLTVLTRRAARWSHLLGARETVGRGMKMWMEVSGAKKKMTSRPGYYQSLLEMPRDEELVEAIRIDVPRTFPDNIYFRDYKEGKLTSLYNVLVAFSQHNKKIGYCQLLWYLTVEMNQYAAFIGTTTNAWALCSEEEVAKFLGLFFLMGVVDLPSMGHYWREQAVHDYPVIRNTMTEVHFCAILKQFHAFNSCAVPAVNTDCSITVHTVMFYLFSRYQSVYLPEERICRMSMCQTLFSHQVSVCGTLRLTHGAPKDLQNLGEKKKNLADDEVQARHKGNVMVLLWKDKCIISMVSTFHSTNTTIKQVHTKMKGQDRKFHHIDKTINKLVMVEDYNGWGGPLRPDGSILSHPKANLQVDQEVNLLPCPDGPLQCPWRRGTARVVGAARDATAAPATTTADTIAIAPATTAASPAITAAPLVAPGPSVTPAAASQARVQRQGGGQGPQAKQRKVLDTDQHLDATCGHSRE